jgi:hypothetical protein
MKTITPILAILVGLCGLCGCYSRKEIQVEMVSAELIKIDTIYRFAGDDQLPKQQLTWRDDQNTEYVSFVPMKTSYLLGTRMAVLRTR